MSGTDQNRRAPYIGLFLLFLFCFILLPACVPKSDLAAVEEEKKECLKEKQALASENAELEKRNASLESRVEKLSEPGPTERAVDSLALILDSLRSRNEVLQDSLYEVRKEMRDKYSSMSDIYDRYRRLERRICSGGS